MIHDEDEWRAALLGAHEALRPGGVLAFESRKPEARGWLRWTPERTRRRVETPEGTVEAWWQVTEVSGDLVRSEIRYRFESTGEELVSSNVIRFRSRADLERSLGEAGFTVRTVYGDWDRSALDGGSPEMIFVAVRG